MTETCHFVFAGSWTMHLIALRYTGGDTAAAYGSKMLYMAGLLLDNVRTG